MENDSEAQGVPTSRRSSWIVRLLRARVNSLGYFVIAVLLGVGVWLILPENEFIIANNSRSNVTHLWIYESNATEIGPDRLPGATIPPGGSKTFGGFSRGTYDVMLHLRKDSGDAIQFTPEEVSWTELSVEYGDQLTLTVRHGY